MTRQRRAVESALAQAEGFCSAQDLHAQLRQLTEQGRVDVVRSDAGEALYRQCGEGEHHHHLRCRQCGHVDELHAPAVETWAQEIGVSSGYTALSHSLEVTGLCPNCA